MVKIKPDEVKVEGPDLSKRVKRPDKPNRRKVGSKKKEAEKQSIPEVDGESKVKTTEKVVGETPKVENPKADSPKKKNRRKKGEPKGPQYPFRTKKSISEQIAIDYDFMIQCFEILESQGFSRNYAGKAKDVRDALSKGKISGDTLEICKKITNSQVKAIASHLRNKAIEEKPELAEVAKLFSAV
jgi:hypothetical protein